MVRKDFYNGRKEIIESMIDLQNKINELMPKLLSNWNSSERHLDKEKLMKYDYNRLYFIEEASHYRDENNIPVFRPIKVSLKRRITSSEANDYGRRHAYFYQRHEDLTSSFSWDEIFNHDLYLNSLKEEIIKKEKWEEENQ